MANIPSSAAQKFAQITGSSGPADDRGVRLGLCAAAEVLLGKVVVYRRMGLTGLKKQLNDEVCSELETRARGLLEDAGVNPNEWISLGVS